jgi:hypothetical protein
VYWSPERKKLEAFQELEDDLDELFPFIFDGDGLVAFLVGCFDESERQELEEPLCVAGFFFRQAGYKQFKRKWRSKVLRFKGRSLRHFHMTDLYAGKREYAGMSIADRITILNHAVEAIGEHTYGGVAVEFQQREFEQKAHPVWPMVFGSIYRAACAMCLDATAYWLNQWGSHLPVFYVFERGHKFDSEFDEVLKAIAKNASAKKHFRYRNHLYEDKEQQLGLQSADLFSWVVTKASVVKGRELPRGLIPFTEPLLKLCTTNPGRYKCYPIRGERLEAYLRDAENTPIDMWIKHGPRRTAFR